MGYSKLHHISSQWWVTGTGRVRKYRSHSVSATMARAIAALEKTGVNDEHIARHLKISQDEISTARKEWPSVFTQEGKNAKTKRHRKAKSSVRKNAS